MPVILRISHILHLIQVMLRKPKTPKLSLIFHKKFICSPFSYISVVLHIGYFRDLLIFNSVIINFQELQPRRFLDLLGFFVMLQTITSILKTF